MKLIDLIYACKETQFQTIGSVDVEIFGITSNTKKITEGYLFVAFQGTKFDGHDFITEAIEKGAVAILGQSGSKFQLSLDNSFSSCFDILSLVNVNLFILHPSLNVEPPMVNISVVCFELSF